MAQLSLAYAMARPGIDCTLVGCCDVKQVLDNAKTEQIVLPSELMAEIDCLSLPILNKLGNNSDYYESSQNSRIY